jgi:hypothetical protein
VSPRLIATEGDTLNDVLRTPPGRAATWGRRGFMSAVAALVLAGATGLLGVHTSTVSATGSDYSMSVQYPAIARAGLDTTFQVTVTHPGGFSKPIVLQISKDYFDMFETQGFFPDASSATRDASNLTLTFAPPTGDTFTMYYDAYIQPSSQRGHSATVSLLVGGSAVASAHLVTRLVP